MLTAELTFFDAALALTGDAATLDAAVAHLPAWAGAWETRDDGSVWAWLECKEVPTRAMIDSWVESVQERVEA